MSDTLQINASVRSDLGKAAMRRLRLEDRVPGVVYGSGKDPIAFSMGHKELARSLENEVFSASVLTLDLDGNTEQVVIKELQRHPYKKKLMHLDLLRVSGSTKLAMTVQLRFINEDIAPGVKVAGGVVSHITTEVDISCLPADLPEFITVDLAELEEGQTLHLSDLKLPEGVEVPSLALGADYDSSVVSIHKQKAESIDDEEVEGDVEGEAGVEE